MSTRAIVEKLLPEAKSFRRDLHQHPELGYGETRTSQKVREKLTEYGVDFRGDLAGGTGVLGYLPATRPGGKCIALRGDMDALPITEETGLSYASAHPGVMHACGHDGHTTMLLTAARTLSQLEERPNDLLFVFQPAEEGGAGGKRMCDDGVLDGSLLGRPVDMIFGIHGSPDQHVGQVLTRVGPLMAAADSFDIVIRGKGAHAAFPHAGIDPIVIASHVIVALQTVASRTVDPLDSVVVTVGKVEAGVAHNVIPDTARLIGTVRTLKAETRTHVHATVEALTQGIARSFGGDARVEWGVGYPVTVNEPTATKHFQRVATQLLGEPNVFDAENPYMGGEDFSFYGHHVPACFFFLGLLPEGQDSYPNLHAPNFDFNDDALAVGVEMMTALALS